MVSYNGTKMQSAAIFISPKQPCFKQPTMRTIIIALAALFLAPWASGMATQKAQAELFTREVGGQVQAAVRFDVDKDWYLYHTDLGHPEAIGRPLTFAWSGGNVAWQEPILPKPGVGEVKEDYMPHYTYNYHAGSFIAWFVGDPAGAKAAGLQVSISGQTCSSKTGSCILFEADLSAKTSDGIWANAPPAMRVVQGGASGAKPGGSFGFDKSDLAGGLTIDKNSFGWIPDYDNNVDARYKLERSGNKVRAVIEIDVREGYHAYHGPTLDDIGPDKPIAQPTVLEWEDGVIDWKDVVYSETHEEDGLSDAGDTIKIKTHHGTWTMTADGEIAEGAELEGLTATLSGQVCDDMGCLGFELELEAEVSEVDSIAGAATSIGDAGGPNSKEQSSLWALIGQAIIWGLITLLMPCTYPMIPITISFFTKQAASRGGSVLPLSLTYGAGIIVIFIGIGLLAAPVIIPFAQHPVTNMIIGALFVYFALTLFGVIALNPPAFMNKMAGQASMKGGLLGVFLMGATLVVTSFTCTAPFVGTLLGSAAAGTAGSEGIIRIIVGMGVFGFVMATPFVLLSLVPGRLQKMPRAGGWMNTIKVFMGFVELAAAFKFFSNADVVLEWGVLGRELFLLIWIVIFVAAAIYLVIGAIKAGKSPVRLGVGAATLAFTVMLGTYLPGKPAGFVLTALLPDYSDVWIQDLTGWGGVKTAQHSIVEDDVQAAVALAKTEEKLLLLNFTGKS
jgi:cytochrome c biogenesis protein CcdA/DsbC/DsbD-like thiol-disulfide interchange protein